MLRIRKATIEDSLGIYEIRNCPEVLKFFFNPNPVSFESHHEWFKKSLESQFRFIYVVHYENELAGVARFDLAPDKKEANVSIYTAKKFWNKGVGSFALLESEELLRNEVPSCLKIIAQVLVENEASLKFFKSCDYIPKLVNLEKLIQSR